jgi:tetratricopeptide (TPR) repeat protein
MLKRFTSLWLVLLSLSLGACSGIPVPLVGEESDNTAPTVGPASVSNAGLMVSAAVPIPELNSGSQALFDRGLELLRAGNSEAAEVLFEELTQDQPELAGPWVNLAKIYLMREAPDQAVLALERALQANPKNCGALTQMGVIARRDGRFDDAEEYYKSCLAAQPTYAAAHLNLGILYELYMGRLSEALAAYNDYQTMVSTPNQQVVGWVMDLERRVESFAKR